jgi:ATP adenylyltransferase
VRRKAATAQSEASGRTALLWAPWRYEYLAGKRPAPVKCIFCFTRLGPAERRHRLILYGDALALVMLNRYPYNNGHLMVALPRRVARTANADERLRLDDLMIHSITQIREALRPAGVNLGANLGRAAGAGFAEHMHWHVVPRWEGDSNFMPVIGATRVLSEHLAHSFDLLAPRFKAIETAIS